MKWKDENDKIVNCVLLYIDITEMCILALIYGTVHGL